ncbi:MAG: N-acetyltransferase [Flavobacteriaceae bacterium]|nr:N-acetyltransferase [Flavobacteriaceae bacterium]MDZ4149010.1 N-acetyltransferase [Flavobacteriaceae bacterium]PKP44125.1 MAG: N-acetyltransferase [Bacteroidetes bacterium HGW-Bacteroidetes-13]
MTTADSIQIKNNEFLRQFECNSCECKATIEYALQERKIFLTKLSVPDELQDETFKNNFIIKVLDYVTEKKLKVVPTSPYIAKFFKTQKNYKDLLSVGIKL